MADTDDKPTTASIAGTASSDEPSDEDAPTARERLTTEARDDLEPLLPDNEATEFRERWHAIQVRFVDEPRTSVEDADALVAELMQRLAETFAKERKELEAAWTGDRDVDTESHRVALRRYRSFFERLLSA